MAVKTYLQTAITQVQTAITEMEGQMNSIRQDAERQKSQLKSTHDGKERERNSHMTALSRAQDDTQRHMLEQRIGSLNHEMDDCRAKMTQIDSDVAHMQQRKDQLHKNLYNVNVELTRLMSLPDIG